MKEVPVDDLIERFNVVQYNGDSTMPRSLLLKYISMSDGILCSLRDNIDLEVLNIATYLKVVSTMSVGTNHIDIEECRKRNILITTTPVLTEATAETTLALLLTVARHIPEAINDAKSGRWSSWSPLYMCGKGLLNSTVGIIGLGRIGTSVAEKLKAFHPSRILYHNRKPNDFRNPTLSS